VTSAEQSTPTLTAPIILLMSVATGLAVASNYYAQPLLHTIGQQFSISNAAAGAIVTTAQLSYAVGLMLLVPLGDMFERRSLIGLMNLLSAAERRQLAGLLKKLLLKQDQDTPGSVGA